MLAGDRGHWLRPTVASGGIEACPVGGACKRTQHMRFYHFPAKCEQIGASFSDTRGSWT
jgi:hypothetical protein